MRGVVLPGGRRTKIRDLADPSPGPGEVLIRPRASTICGSDVRAIYREHLGTGPEAYQDVVAGHEPAGDVVQVGEGVRRLVPGDRVAVYHISGCGECDDCRRGYQISCTSKQRAAYGWQRDGGHAELLLAKERDLLELPDGVTYLDGACVACGGGTAYEALCRGGVGADTEVLVTGLGPVGLMAGLLARALDAPAVFGTDPSAQRREQAERTGAFTAVFDGDGEALSEAVGNGAHVAVDCSGAEGGRQTALTRVRRWGTVVFVGEGGRLDIDVSEQLIHRAVTVIGSWVTSTGRMAELLNLLDRRGLHLDQVVTNTFRLDQAAEAYQLADAGTGGKVGIVQDALDGLEQPPRR